MTYSYPAPRTGTAQDLFRVVTRAYELELERRGTVLPVKSDFARRWLAAPALLFGVCLARLLESMPAEWSLAFHDFVYARLCGRDYPFDPSSPAIARARALAERVESETGSAPALMAAISHPPTLGELAHLNFALTRHAQSTLRAVRGRPCRPRHVVAIDPFALDTASIPEEGFYVGSMGTYHLGIDRLSLGRAGTWRFLTPKAAWFAMPWRLLRSLGAGGEVGIILAGGVPATGRVLYGVREWVGRARDASPLKGSPGAVRRALRGDASFAGCEREATQAAFPSRSTWRLTEAWLMSVAAGLHGGATLEAAASAVLESLSVPLESRPALLGELRLESSRETPMRRRLFRIIAGRLRRRPLVFIPIVHRLEPSGVEVREAFSWEASSRGRVRVRRADDPGSSVEMDPGQFAGRFVEENFA